MRNLFVLLPLYLLPLTEARKDCHTAESAEITSSIQQLSTKMDSGMLIHSKQSNISIRSSSNGSLETDHKLSLIIPHVTEGSPTQQQLPIVAYILSIISIQSKEILQATSSE